MKTTKDVVKEQARELPELYSTGDGIKLLGLEHNEKNFGAANLYLAALKIIKELMETNREMQ